MKEIHSVAIVGMGALGLLYGNQIINGMGLDFAKNVVYVMDKDRWIKNKDEVFTCNGQKCAINMIKEEDAKPVDLVLVCVKSTGLERAIKTLKNLIGKETIILSVMNGISSEKIIAETYGMEHIVYTVAQGMDAMKFGNALTYTKAGELHIGKTADTKSENVDAVQAFFEKAKVPYALEKDIMFRMWSKFMLNVGVNQTCMVYGTTYSGVLESGSEPNRSFIGAMREVVAIANAEGIPLSEKDLNFYVDIIRSLSPSGTPSMGQDRINKKPSEVEMFAGTVIKIAKKHHIYVPVNEYFYSQVKKIEKDYVNS